MTSIPVIPGVTYLAFQGHSLVRRSESPRQFSAVCGDNPPTITDGYGKWNVVDRPLRQGVTVPAGFNPARVKVEVRFGVWDGRFNFRGWDTSADAAMQNEIDIDSLHWMAGGNFVGGPSPLVYMEAYNAPNNRSHLNPRQYWGVGWVIDGGIEWGKSLRNPRNGCRTYQEATFTLLGFLGVGVKPPQESGQLTGGYFRTTATFRTALAIAANPTSRSPQPFHESLARQICSDPHNNPCHASRVKLERRSIRWPMPLGLEVWVPSHAV